MFSKGKVLVAMSGGIDSTVAAMMLKEEGYDVIGITMKTWDYATSSTNNNSKQTGCCDLDSFNDARTIAVKYKFPHYIIDIREEFTDAVIKNFVNEYIDGKTPNPCILCNTHIKWNALLKKANSLNCNFIATGHYAQIKQKDNRFILYKAKDLSKDQSYVLWGLNQDVLKKTIFPLGNYLKTEVREYAKNKGFTRLSEKKESYEICFIPDNNYRDFLIKQKPELSKKIENGIFTDKNGNIIGKHNGYPFFTIGQRRGLGIAFGQATFVIKIIPEKNIVVLGNEEDLKEHQMFVKDFNFIKYENLYEEKYSITKIRYRDAGSLANIKQLNSDIIEVNFTNEVKGITQGQSAVFYDGDEVIGGGIITNYNKQ